MRALAEELTKTIDLARALAESGRAIDLTGLDDEVGLLCAKSLDLPPDEGRRVRPRLIALSGCDGGAVARPGDARRAIRLIAAFAARQKAAPWSSDPPRS